MVAQGGPLLIINGVITSINKLINGFHSGYFTPISYNPTKLVGAHFVSEMILSGDRWGAHQPAAFRQRPCFWRFLPRQNRRPKKKRSTCKVHPGRLTWNLQITHLERKMIFQTSMIMFHVNLQGCTVDGSGQIISRPHEPTDLTPQKVAAFGREMGPRKFQENTGW